MGHVKSIAIIGQMHEWNQQTFLLISLGFEYLYLKTLPCSIEITVNIFLFSGSFFPSEVSNVMSHYLSGIKDRLI